MVACIIDPCGSGVGLQVVHSKVPVLSFVLLSLVVDLCACVTPSVIITIADGCNDVVAHAEIMHCLMGSGRCQAKVDSNCCSNFGTICVA